MKIVRVALAVPLPRLFDYLIPDDVSLQIGMRVLVPFGTQKRVAIVTDFPTKSDVPEDKLKAILQPLDLSPLFTPIYWDWLHWAANYYQAGLGDVLFQALPVKLRNGESAAKNDRTFWRITDAGKNALEQGLLKRSKKQVEALQCLSETDLEKGNNDFSSAIWSALKAKGFIEEITIQTKPLSWQQSLGDNPIVNAENRLTLNKQQALAFSQLLFHSGFNVWLLDGVTGSGKTEIYIELIKKEEFENKIRERFKQEGKESAKPLVNAITNEDTKISGSRRNRCRNICKYTEVHSIELL